MNRASIDIWVGLFVAAGIAAVLFLALRVSNPSSFGGNDGIEVAARFDNIGALKANAPVKSAGVVVGRVSKIRFDNQTYRALVTMQLFDAYHFSKDSSAQILTSGLLGEQYIGLETGADSQMLQQGDTITITSSAVVLEQLISQFLFSKAAETKPQQ